MLSIFGTLKQTLFLWAKNFRYLVVFFLIGFLPMFGVLHLEDSVGDHSSAAYILLRSLHAFLDAFLGVLDVVLILGLLQQPTLRDSVWRGIWSIAKNCTSSVLGAFLIFIGIGFVIIVVIYVGMQPFNVPYLPLLALPLACCVYFKFVLAAPVIVIENLGPWKASCRSWEMTRGRFWYVGGNCLFLWGGLWLVNYVLQRYVYVHDLGGFMSAITFIPYLAYGILGQSWGILCWCMYQRIKKSKLFCLQRLLANQSIIASN